MSFGQHFDYKVNPPNDYHRLGTAQKNMDTLSLWNYRLDLTYVPARHDSATPLGFIRFWRIKPIANDPILNEQAPPPGINFEIFDIRDSSFCYRSAHNAIFYSSCVPPNVGGDVFVIGKFIFLNRSACVHCGSAGAPHVDYCRPVINFIFKTLADSDISTLADIVRYLPIRSGRQS